MSEWIATDNIPVETWRRIIEYANIDYSLAAIEARHGAPGTSSTRGNYSKQAEQIRVSILQSKEYFDAASASSLFTSPNHLYYGMVALTAAVMLLGGTGENSLDRLRQNVANRSHGLGFSTGVTRSTCREGLSLLQHSYVEVMPSGFFINWYGTLPSVYDVYAVAKFKEEKLTNTMRHAEGRERILTSDEIAGRRNTVLDLLGRIPDLYQSFLRCGHTIAASRCNFDVEIEIPNGIRASKWSIHGAPTTLELEKILDGFRSPAKFIKNWNCTDYTGKLGCIVDFSFHYPKEHPFFQWPSMRETINNDQVIYAKKLDTHEIVDAYMAAYAMSMLSRYYPDLWIRCLESHCMAATVVEHFVHLMEKKFPIMALKLLAGDDIVISTHRPPWYR